MTVIRNSDIAMMPLEGRRSGDPLADVITTSSLRIVDLEPGASRTAHIHPYSEEIAVVVSGRGVVWIDGQPSTIAPGDVVCIPAGAAHATVAHEPVRLHCFFPHPELADNLEKTDIVVSNDPNTPQEHA